MFFPLCIGELTLRIYAPRLSTHDDFLRFSANALEQGQSLVEYGTYIDQRDFADDPEGRDLLGWSRTSNWYDDKPTAQEKFSILLLGDSVTQGDGLEPQEVYPHLLYRKFAENSVKVLNAGCSGYGIDQMLFKGLRESHKHKPDLIIFSFIPHDLIRVSKNFMYGRGKPKITFTGDTISVDPAVNAGLRHDSYEQALNGSSLLYWYLQNEIWPNTEYYAPELYREYYRKVYTYIYEQMATLAKERRLEIVFVKLTNSFEFRGEKTLISVAEEVFSANTAAGLSYYDMDECVGREIDLDDPESDSMFYFHPTAEGHRLFADCLSELITSANRQHAPQSH